MQDPLEKAVDQVVTGLQKAGFCCDPVIALKDVAGIRAVKILNWCFSFAKHNVVRADVVAGPEPWEIRFHEIDVKEPYQLVLNDTPDNSSWSAGSVDRG